MTHDPRSGLSCEVEIFPDGGRLHPPVVLGLGAVLHLDDLAADKVLALWAEPKSAFQEALRAIRRFDPEDWAATGIKTDTIQHTQNTVAEWIDELND